MEYRHWVEANAEQSRSRNTSVNSATELENHAKCIAEVPEVAGSTEGPLPYETQEIIVGPDNDAGATSTVMDMELEPSQEGPHSLTEQSGNEPPQQDITCALTRYIDSYAAVCTCMPYPIL